MPLRKYNRRAKKPVLRKRKRVFRRYRKMRPFAPLKIQNSIRRLQKFRYTEFMTITPGAGAIGKYVFSANGLFDPNITGVGHQPLKFDQFSAFFDHYMVVGSKISVKLLGSLQTDASSVPFVWGVALDDDNSTPTDYRTMIEQGRSPYRCHNGTNANLTQTVKNYFSCKKFFRVTNPKDNLVRLGAIFSSNPSDQAYFTVWAQAMDQVGTAPALNYVVNLDFVALLSEGKDLPTS